MTSAPASLTATLAQLLSLDVPTVEQQLMPYLGSLTTLQQVRSHLSELLPHSTTSDRWKHDYESWRGFHASSTTAAKSGNAEGKLAWGKSTSKGRDEVTAATSSSNTTKPSLDRQALEKQFGNSGKVYIKNRDNDGDAGWGGGATTRSSQPASASSSRPASGRASPSGPAPGSSSTTDSSRAAQPHAKPAAPLPSTSTSKGKSKASADPVTLDLSEQAAAELLGIDKALRSFSISDKRPVDSKRVCFCQARRHVLSPFVPLCPSCALVICSINPPSAPCSSCARAPLLSADRVAQHVARLREEKDALIEREMRRVERVREQEERERAAMRFPELAGGPAGQAPRGSVGVRNYAEHAGGSGGRIDRAIRAAHAGQGSESIATTSAVDKAPKVLRLDMKTKKVKIQTKASVKSGKGKSQAQASEAADDDPQEDDVDDAWIDENDDGWRARSGQANKENDRPLADGGKTAGSGFYANQTIPESKRFLYVEPREAQLMDGGDTETVVEAPTTALALLAAKNNRVVPGAAPQAKETESGSKGKKGRGAKQKGKNANVV